MEKVAKITETTLLPISLVLTIIGGVFWLTMIYSQTEANAKEISKIKDDGREIISKIDEKQTLMLDRLSRIEGRLEIIQHKQEK